MYLNVCSCNRGPAAATDTVIATVTVGAGPSAVAISPDGTRAYVTTAYNAVSVIDTATNTVTTTITVGPNPTGLAITPDGTRIYVADTGYGAGNTVSVIAVEQASTPSPVGSLGSTGGLGSLARPR